MTLRLCEKQIDDIMSVYSCQKATLNIEVGCKVRNHFIDLSHIYSLHKCCDDLVSHEDVDKDASEEGESSAGLGDDVEVDNGVQDPGADKDSEVSEY